MLRGVKYTGGASKFLNDFKKKFKPFLGMSIRVRRSSLTKKPEVKNLMTLSF
jgi:hypothetical protein